MKKSLLLIVTALLITFSATSAQSFKAGGGLAYATDLNGIGISANGLYQIDKQWEVGGSFIFFFEKDLVSWKSLNANAHYIFADQNNFKWYGLAGINITFASVDFPEYTTPWGTYGGDSESTSDFGFNIGAGGRTALTKSIDLFGEAQYTIQSGGYLTFNFGVLFSL